MKKIPKKINKKKILIAEDDRGILAPITLLLENALYEVKTTVYGSEVVSLMESLRPDLLLLDVSLSDGDGRDLCVELKKNSLVKHIPIILMSAHNNLREMASDSGAQDFISKPFNIVSLLHKISKNLTIS